MAKALKILFAGTPRFAAQHLQGLLADGSHSIIGVYTQPDRPAGRGQRITTNPVKTVALAHGIPVFQPTSLKKPATQDALRALDADLMVVVAYGLLLPPAVLDIPRLSCINVHASLLPRWRGAAPIERAIEAGDQTTGVSIMQMDAGLDTGDLLLTSHCDITAQETSDSLQKKLIVLGIPALITAINQLANGTAAYTPQNHHLSCYAKKITKTETAINWQQSAEVLARKIRAFHPFWVCYTTLHEERIKIWQAQYEPAIQGPAGTILSASKQGIIVACGQGGLRLTQLQLAGGKVLDSAAIMNARAAWFSPGACFDEPQT